MKKSNSDKLTLATLGNLMSDVDRVLVHICENIADPDTVAEEIRKLTITIRITPDAKRSTALIEYSLKSTLGHPSPGTVVAEIAMDEHRQLSLFSVTKQQDVMRFETTQ